MNTLIWSDELTLHQPRMDATHREFVDLLAELEQSIDGRSEAVDAALTQIIEHTEEHFAQEERWMAAIGFAPENCHSFQHTHVLQVMNEINRLHQADGDTRLVRQLVGELAKWFPVHAQMMDAALAQTIAERGYDTETGTLASELPADTVPITGCGGASCS